MAWLEEVMEGVERLMAMSKGESGDKYVGQLWQDAQCEAYKKVANLLATIAGVEEPYPNNKEVN